MKPWIIGAWLLILCLIAASILSLKGQLDGTRGQLEQARTQFAAQERSDRAAVDSLNRAYSRAQQALTAAEARIGGTHRDLITCADWQTLFLTVSGVDSFNGQISASAGPPTLPQHCINQ